MAAAPFTPTELAAHLARARRLKWSCLALGLLAVGLMVGVFVLPAVVPVPRLLQPVVEIPGGFKLWVLLWDAPQLWGFWQCVRYIRASTEELERAAGRIRAVEDPACAPLLQAALQGTDTLTAGAAREALGRLARGTAG